MFTPLAAAEEQQLPAFDLRSWHRLALRDAIQSLDEPGPCAGVVSAHGGPQRPDPPRSNSRGHSRSQPSGRTSSLSVSMPTVREVPPPSVWRVWCACFLRRSWRRFQPPSGNCFPRERFDPGAALLGVAALGASAVGCNGRQQSARVRVRRGRRSLVDAFPACAAGAAAFARAHARGIDCGERRHLHDGGLGQRWPARCLGGFLVAVSGAAAVFATAAGLLLVAAALLGSGARAGPSADRSGRSRARSADAGGRLRLDRARTAASAADRPRCGAVVRSVAASTS